MRKMTLLVSQEGIIIGIDAKNLELFIMCWNNDNKMDSELKLWVTWLICDLRPNDLNLPPVIFMWLVSFPFVLGQNLPQIWLLMRTMILYAENLYSNFIVILFWNIAWHQKQDKLKLVHMIHNKVDQSSS